MDRYSRAFKILQSSNTIDHGNEGKIPISELFPPQDTNDSDCSRSSDIDLPPFADRAPIESLDNSDGKTNNKNIRLSRRHISLVLHNTFKLIDTENYVMKHSGSVTILKKNLVTLLFSQTRD